MPTMQEHAAAINEAAPFLAVLARVHEVFDNLAPGRAGRLGGAWHLFNAGWRAEMTVDDAHRLLDRQREWRDIDQWRAWADRDLEGPRRGVPQGPRPLTS